MSKIYTRTEEGNDNSEFIDITDDYFDHLMWIDKVEIEGDADAIALLNRVASIAHSVLLSDDRSLARYMACQYHNLYDLIERLHVVKQDVSGTYIWDSKRNTYVAI